MCVENRRLNSASLLDAYSMPKIKDLIHGLVHHDFGPLSGLLAGANGKMSKALDGIQLI